MKKIRRDVKGKIIAWIGRRGQGSRFWVEEYQIYFEGCQMFWKFWNYRKLDKKKILSLKYRWHFQNQRNDHKMYWKSLGIQDFSINFETVFKIIEFAEISKASTNSTDFQCSFKKFPCISFRISYKLGKTLNEGPILREVSHFGETQDFFFGKIPSH